MPYYDLRCEACQTESNIKATVEERVSGTMTCPSCGSDRLVTVYKRVNIIQQRGSGCDSCPTIGDEGCCGGSCSLPGGSWR
ncbi:MAG: zinc ribbon domain-containing protein [Eubacteriales bacterium]|nr:zinc ribbon domain-containing protein [Eubacteriales bacterium]MDD3866451.1 zinc ribbon domain-containing protein [Eubacteriales bacterium]MDD4461788.1 zinc ribbon domain-containing protein [Eubacteriales bacterium]